jgi:hypothetical protein
MLRQLAGFAALVPVAAQGQPLQWQPLPGTAPSTPGVVWRAEPPDQSTKPKPVVSWEAVPPEEMGNPFKAPTPTTAVASSEDPKPKDPFITGGLYQVKRGDEWLPSISQRVPNAYGSTLGTLQTGLFVESCNVTGDTVCGTRSFGEEFNSNAKGIWSFLLGLGDPRKAIGIDLGFQITSLATTRPNANSGPSFTGDSGGTKFGEGRGLDLSISRNFSENVSLKLGVFNLITLDEVQQLDQPSSAYGVVSARFDLGGRPEDNSNDLYITLGAANGLYRPLNVIVADQEQTCAAEKASKGRNSEGIYGLKYCNIWGFSYGDPYPVASVSYLLNNQVSFIAEWWGRNLTLAASIKPIDGLNWVITPGITNLIKNADWDPAIPGYTTTPRFQLTTSIGF